MHIKNQHALVLVLTSVFLMVTLAALLLDQRALIPAFDTGIYLQLAHNFIFSFSLGSSIVGETNFLAHHFQPAFLLLSPIPALIPRPTALFFLTALSVAVSMWFIFRDLKQNPATKTMPLLTLAVALAWAMQPTIVQRAFWNFCPDILALPAFFWMALHLDPAPRPKENPPPLHHWIIAMLWAGMCKENFWMINVAICLVQIYRSKNYAKWGSLAALNLAIFLCLYLWWMPTHTNLPSYYARRFYFGDDSEALSVFGALSILFQNFFSLQSLNTLFMLALLSLGLPFLRLRPNLFIAGVGLAFILLGRASQLHQIENHYLIPVLPFLVVCALRNISMIEKEKKIPVPVIRWLTLAVMLVPAFWSVFQGSGVLYHADKAWANPRTEFFRRDALHFKEYKLPQDANLLTNGNLIPLFYDHPHLMDVLSYEGNPKKLTASELKGEFYLLLTDDMREVNDCADIQVGGKNLKVDHEYFVAICERVKKNAQLVEAYPRSGLIALHILAL